MQSKKTNKYATTITLVIGIALIVAACTSKKVSKSTDTSTPVTKTTPTTPVSTSTASTFSMAKSLDGIYPPGNAELTAIQVQYKDVTLDKLNEGHVLYTKGACRGCHEAQSIYKFGEGQWYSIIEDMARKANITDAQKDAVYKYVLAIKATQPK